MWGVVMEKSPHYSVLLDEITSFLDLKKGGIYVDCTFGAGGYSKKILNSCDCRVIAIDRDETVVPTAHLLKKEYGNRFDFALDRFSNIKSVLDSFGVENVSGIVCDLGVSSMQLDNADKGFSFAKDGPLTMQMGCNEISAYDVVNDYDEEDIANIIYKYGEERFSRRIARAIVNARSEKPIERTLELAEIVARSVPAKTQINPATRTFQALRIYVNEELKEVENVLGDSLSLLQKGGRMVMVSFHSLEDRIVKSFFNEHSGKNSGTSRYLPQVVENSAELKVITRKPVIAGEQELGENARSRSAKLRAAEKL